MIAMVSISRSRLAAALLALFALLLYAPEAKAIEYELFIDVDTEDELYDLWVSGQISGPAGRQGPAPRSGHTGVPTG